ncbi:MAG: SDR family NAD(P)-dependent oxidoreductase, partial [Novosphingobium sp.]|nr:SDR family NAD(P)-dependent oxidoreductase [Novosphingobium sp.]
MTLIPDMNGEAAVVTGAASGLGRATAVKLAEAGANLCLVDLNKAGLQETSGLLSGAGVEVILHPADLSDPDACKPAVDAAVERFGRLDALCNIAGLIRFANSPQMPREDWDRTIAVNLTAPFLLSQAAIPHLLETEGAIVNCSSTAAFVGEAYAAAYCASKAGLLQMTKAMAM